MLNPQDLFVFDNGNKIWALTAAWSTADSVYFGRLSSLFFHMWYMSEIHSLIQKFWELMKFINWISHFCYFLLNNSATSLVGFRILKLICVLIVSQASQVNIIPKITIEGETFNISFRHVELFFWDYFLMVLSHGNQCV